MKTFLSTLVLLSVFSIHSLAQSQDRFPAFPVQITAIEWNVTVEPTLDGFTSTASYQLRSNRDNVQTIALAQRDLIVESVTQGGEELPFVLTSDSIRVTLREPVGRGADIRLAIGYRAYPTYGFFMDPSALVWTSGLPGVVAGLLPILEHPRVRFRTDVTITHPSIIQVVTNGGYVSRTVLNVSEARTVFRSRTPITSSSLRVSFGMMQSSEMRIGSIPVRMYVGDNTSVADGGRALLALAGAEIQRVSTQLRSPFPFEGMNFLVAPSSYGEAWGDGAGFAILYDDLGGLENQIRIAVASQWLRHSLQAMESEVQYALSAYTLQLARLDNSSLIDPSVAFLTGLHNATDLVGILVHAGSAHDRSGFPLQDLDYISRYIPGLVWKNDLDEIRFASDWVPRPLPEIPPFLRHQPQHVANKAQTGFILRFDRTENPEIVNLVIDPFGSPERREYVMILREVYLNDTISQTVRFSESGGEIRLEVGSGLLNMLPTLEDGFEYRVEKPLGYWLHQYRNAAERSDKIDAARALGAFAGDPDFGLLIRELERNELDQTVKASMMLGMMENGVAEMSEASIGALLESGEPEVRVDALEMIDRKTESLISVDYLLSMYSKSETTSEERRLIAKLLSKNMQSDEFDAFVQAESKKPGGKELLSILLQAFIEEGSIDAGIDMADVLIGREYPFTVRLDALMMLEIHDTNSQRWSARLPRLASDQDPRVRMMALDLVGKLDEGQASILLQDRGAKEADSRVRARIETIRR